MANTKSAKKQARVSVKRKFVNQARSSDMKSATKKVMDALMNNDVELAKELIRIAESKISRASGKGLVKKGTATRKISRLAKKVSSASKAQKEAKATK